MHAPSAVAALAIVVALGATDVLRVRHAPDVAALAPLAGEWQSDTVDGISARSVCAWTPQHAALMCNQRIEGIPGVTSALNMFTSDSIAGGFSLYVVSRAGGVLTPIPIDIHGTQWFYGGKSASADGKWYRTVNDFSRADSYEWRQETSLDGTHWTAGTHGHSRQIR